MPPTGKSTTSEEVESYKLYLLLGLVLLGAGFFFRNDLIWTLAKLEAWVNQAGPEAPFIAAAFCSVWATLCLPGPPVLGLIGTLFADEPLVALLVVLFGDTFATVVGFQVTRHLGRERVKAWLGEKPWFHWLEEQIAARGLYGVFVVRMMPFFPNSLANYALGLTNLRFWPYLGASVAGSIPNLALYVFGSAGVVSLLREGFASPMSLGGGAIVLAAVSVALVALQRWLSRGN